MKSLGIMLLCAMSGSVSVQIDVGKPDRDEAWQRARAALSRCASADVTIWYDFGSARIRATPAARACRVELALETETAEHKWSCSLPLGKPWTWELISDGERIRNAPPSQLPPELAKACKPR